MNEGDVWHNTVDNETWSTDVHRIAPYRGLLTVTEVATGETVHAEEVGLSYQAIFGPDIDDVESWKGKCIDVIDHPEKRTPPQKRQA